MSYTTWNAVRGWNHKVFNETMQKLARTAIQNFKNVKRIWGKSPSVNDCQRITAMRVLNISYWMQWNGSQIKSTYQVRQTYLNVCSIWNISLTSTLEFTRRYRQVQGTDYPLWVEWGLNYFLKMYHFRTKSISDQKLLDL